MADEYDADVPRDIDADVDPAALAEVQHLLGDLDFLRPDAVEPIAMPDAVWDRLSGVLAAQQAAPVSTGRTRPSRAVRWAGGLVAASVAVLAVGVAVTAFQGNGSGGAVVAGDAPATAVAQELGAADSAAGAAPETASELLSSPKTLSFAGLAPTQMLVDSDTAYTSTGLRSQVRSVLNAFGIADKREAESVMSAPAMTDMEAMPMRGFMATEQTLRDCIETLTKDAEATALMVDKATFEGQDAGVVVAPTEPPAASQPDLGLLQVWVVDQDCDILVKGVTIRLVP